MTTRAEIIGSGPGTATIRILSNEIRTPIEAFQIQRNQMPDAYLAFSWCRALGRKPDVI